MVTHYSGVGTRSAVLQMDSNPLLAPIGVSLVKMLSSREHLELGKCKPGELSVHGPPGLQQEFKVSLGSLVKP